MHRPNSSTTAGLIVLAAFAGPWLLTATVHAQDPTRFEADIQAFERTDAAQPPPPAPVLFVGSSTIRMWPNLAAAFPDYAVLNRGFGGSQMTDLLHYFDRVVAAYQPALVVVYEGDNDLSEGKAVARVRADYEEFLDRMRRQLPQTPVIFLAVKPSPSRAHLLAFQRALNAAIQDLAAAESRVEFVDVFTPMLGADGQPRSELFQSDRLHLNAAGYELCESLLAPALAAALPIAPHPGAPPPSWFIDFGSSAAPTQRGVSPDDPEFVWNNVTETLGAAPSGRLLNLVNGLGRSTPAGLVVLRSFQGVNQAGSTDSERYPVNATRDSLFGGDDPSGDAGAASPAFRLIRLDPELTYDLRFFASVPRTDGPSETTYTVTGASTSTATLRVAGNLTNTALVVGVRPTPNGEVVIALSGAAGADRESQLAHLGILELAPRPPEARLDAPALENREVRLNWEGPGRLEWAPRVTGPWTLLDPAPAAPYFEPVDAMLERYFRLNANVE